MANTSNEYLDSNGLKKVFELLKNNIGKSEFDNVVDGEGKDITNFKEPGVYRHVKILGLNDKYEQAYSYDYIDPDWTFTVIIKKYTDDLSVYTAYLENTSPLRIFQKTANYNGNGLRAWKELDREDLQKRELVKIYSSRDADTALQPGFLYCDMRTNIPNTDYYNNDVDCMLYNIVSTNSRDEDLTYHVIQRLYYTDKSYGTWERLLKVTYPIDIITKGEWVRLDNTNDDLSYLDDDKIDEIYKSVFG